MSLGGRLNRLPSPYQHEKGPVPYLTTVVIKQKKDPSNLFLPLPYPKIS